MNYIFLLAFNLIKTYICYEIYMGAVHKKSFYLKRELLKATSGECPFSCTIFIACIAIMYI